MGQLELKALKGKLVKTVRAEIGLFSDDCGDATVPCAGGQVKVVAAEVRKRQFEMALTDMTLGEDNGQTTSYKMTSCYVDVPAACKAAGKEPKARPDGATILLSGTRGVPWYPWVAGSRMLRLDTCVPETLNRPASSQSGRESLCL